MTFPVLSANGPSGYNLTRSLRFRSSASANLSKTFAASPTVQTKQTLSVWCKRGTLATAQRLMAGYDGVQANGTRLLFQSGDNLEFRFNLSSVLITTAVYRDPSAWYHVLVSIDTTQATAANRLSLYVNGVKVTDFSTATYPTQNDVSQFVLNNGNNKIGSQDNNTFYFDGYMAEMNFIDGQALTPSSFGSTNATTGVWQPAKYGGTYGTNGFYLPFSDNSALTTASNAGLGKDFSGNANYWVTNNISLTAGATYDSMTDVPTLTSATAANYPVANPLWKEATTTITNGNLNVTGGNQGGFSTMAMPTGSKFYCEATVTIVEGFQAVGIVKASAFSGSLSSASLFGLNAYSYYAPSGNKYVLGTSTAYGSAWGTVNDVIGIAVDLSANTLTFYKNNVSQGAISIASGIDYHFGVSNAGVDGAVAFNFGQQPFTYTPPTGFIRLNTYNITASTVPNGAAYLAATLYTGTLLSNSISNAVGSTSFQPDLVWIKSRSAATDNKLTDSVRGVTKGLISNTTGAETTDTQGLTAFGSTGFTVGTDTNYNNLSATYVAWQWKGGGTAVSNTNGTITSSVSANTTSGCSVVTYTGNATANATVGHGLGVTPQFFVVKIRSTTGEWCVYHTSIGKDKYLFLQATDAAATSANFWGTTGPTSSTIQLNSGGAVNNSGSTHVAYCFAAIKGFSAFGSYTGNGSTDSPFVYLGFRPRFVLIKSSSDITNWNLWDSSRLGYNVTNSFLNPDLSNAETIFLSDVDFLSNGFKLRTSWTSLNQSGSTYIYMAFAENPFQNALAR